MIVHADAESREPGRSETTDTLLATVMFYRHQITTVPGVAHSYHSGNTDENTDGECNKVTAKERTAEDTPGTQDAAFTIQLGCNGLDPGYVGSLGYASK